MFYSLFSLPKKEERKKERNIASKVKVQETVGGDNKSNYCRGLA